jgi:hypothetical protein
MERLIRKDKNGRERFTDIRIENLGNGTADIVKVCGVVGSEKTTESRTNVKTGYERACARAQTMWNNETNEGYPGVAHVGQQVGRPSKVHH